MRDNVRDKDKNESKEKVRSDVDDRNVPDSSRSPDPVVDKLNSEDKQELIKGISDRLLPQLQEYIDKSIKKYELPKESMPNATATINNETRTMEPVSQLLKGLGIQSAQGQGLESQPGSESSNPLGTLLAGGGSQLGLLMDLLKMFGVGVPQQSALGGPMGELMQKVFLEDISFSSLLKKAAVQNLFKENPGILAEYNHLSANFIGKDLRDTANILEARRNQPTT